MTSTELRVKKAYYILFTILSPVASIILLLRSKSKSIITFIGTFLFGVLGSVFIYQPGSDGETHLLDVKEHYLDMSVAEFFSDTFKLLTFQPTETSTDLYKHIISFLSGSVFGVPELIQVFGGLLLGYFFTRTALLVLEDKSQKKLGFLLLSLIVLFFLIRTVTALNSLRMWTGMWVFFYGAYGYIKRKEKKYLLYIALAAFVHFSYLLYALPLIAAFFLRNKKSLIIGIFFASFFVSVGFQNAFNFVEKTGFYEGKANSNIQDEDLKKILAKSRAKREKGNFYKEFGEKFYKDYSLPILAIVLILIYYKKTRIAHFDFLITAGLLIYTLSNFAKEVSPSVSGRGYTIAGTFLLVAAIQLLLNKEKLITSNLKKNIINIGFRLFLITAIPVSLFHISFIFNSFSFYSIILPFSSWYLGDSDISIRDAIAAIIL